jgi:hypothetical protein
MEIGQEKPGAIGKGFYLGIILNEDKIIPHKIIAQGGEKKRGSQKKNEKRKPQGFGAKNEERIFLNAIHGVRPAIRNLDMGILF